MIFSSPGSHDDDTTSSKEAVMPAPTLTVGAPCWIDLFSSDTDGAAAFYGRLLGWKAEPPQEELGGYFTFTKDGKHVAGCMRNDGSMGYPDGWGVHLVTRDVDALAAAAPEHGGTVLMGPMVVAENGSSAMVKDPGGAVVGAWQPNRQEGFEVTGEVGAPSWFELHTGAYDESVAFYREVFGWDAHVMSDTDEFRYTTLGSGESALAGIMDDAAEPSGWNVYFAVADADAALEQVVELGGTVLAAAEDTPYGRLARAGDPTGVAFRLMARS
jgi:predicted enzyme related to lactoylglutathione lyase